MIKLLMCSQFKFNQHFLRQTISGPHGVNQATHAKFKIQRPYQRSEETTPTGRSRHCERLQTKRQESINTEMHWQHHSCSSAVLDLAACQLFDAVRSRFNIPPLPPFPFSCRSYLGDVVSAVFATDGFDGTDIQSSKDLWAGIDPLLVPVKEGSPVRSTKSHDQQTGDQRPQSCPLTCAVWIIGALLSCDVGTWVGSSELTR